ncbi:MAG: 30S ribosomal protein S1 [Chlorobi bacterium]|nr:30S ribosomal protein S1 [Chlorobiota bacterium]
MEAVGIVPDYTTDILNAEQIKDLDFADLDIDDTAFETLTDSTIVSIKEDELVTGIITQISKDEVQVDIGFKSFGVIPRAELLNAETLELGDKIDVFIEKMEDPNGKLILSRRRADFMRIWEDILKLYNDETITPVRILRRIKGGMVVDLLGIEAFLPGSQIDVRPVRDFDGWVGKVIEIRVVKVNHPSENVVVSHKVLLEEQIAEQRMAIISKLEKGLVLEGAVKAISDFGIFVDLGGVDGLVHITDLSWGRVTHPSEIVKLDEVVKVVVLDFDTEKRRISLGMKQLTPHPWNTIGDKYEKDSKVTGKVVSLTDYGAFIEIEKGIEGLIHISEMSWTQHVKHPSQIVSMGQIIEATVLNIDKENKKLALGMKQLEPDPWQDLMKKYPVESKHKGIVRNLTNFGVFIELEPGVDGLVHISDLSWTKKIRHPGEFVKKGDEIEVVVLSIDPDQRRIALGHKQIKDNPWDYFEEKYKVTAETEAKIERIIEKGVIVELPDAVDGFVPVSQLSFVPVRNISEYFRIGDLLPLRVVEFDKDAKKIVLSVVEALRDKDQAEIDIYIAAHPVPNAEKYSSETKKEEAPAAEVKAPAEEVKDDAPVEEAKVDAPAEEAKVDVPAEEAKVEAPAEEAKVEAPAEEAKVEAPAEEAKVEAPAEEVKEDAPVEEVKEDAPVEEAKVDVPAEEAKVDAPAEEVKEDAPAEEAKVEAPAEETKVEAPAEEEAKQETLFEEAKDEAPAEDDKKEESKD